MYIVLRLHVVATGSRAVPFENERELLTSRLLLATKLSIVISLFAELCFQLSHPILQLTTA